MCQESRMSLDQEFIGFGIQNGRRGCEDMNKGVNVEWNHKVLGFCGVMSIPRTYVLLN